MIKLKWFAYKDSILSWHEIDLTGTAWLDVCLLAFSDQFIPANIIAVLGKGQEVKAVVFYVGNILIDRPRSI